MSATNEESKNKKSPTVPVLNEILAANEMAANKNVEGIGSDSIPSNEKNTHQLSTNVDAKKVAVKRTPKRLSFIERAQKESEELVRNMGGSLELEGGRRTRSSTRGTPTRSLAASTPPPTKKSRNSASTGSDVQTRTQRRRGKGRKLDTTVVDTDEEANANVDLKKQTLNKKERLRDDGIEQERLIIGDEEENKNMVVNKVEEVKSESVSLIEESEQQNKEKEAVTPIDKGKNDNSTTLPYKQQQSLNKKSDTALPTVSEETSSQMNEETKQMKLSREELTVPHDNACRQTGSSVENDLKHQLNISPCKSEKQERQSLSPSVSPQQQKQEQTELTTASSSMESVKLTDNSEDSTEDSVKQIIISENDVDDAPMEIDSSSKSNDAIEIIENDSNMAESIKSTKKHIVGPDTSDNRTRTEYKLDETLTSNVINLIEDNSDENSSKTNANINTNAIAIDLKASGDHVMETVNLIETINCNKSSSNNKEHKKIESENDKNECENNTPVTTGTAPSNI